MEKLNKPSFVAPTVTGLPWPGVRYFCTTRQGGVSEHAWATLNLGLHAGDEASHVLANRARLRTMLPEEPIWLKQVHGADVFDADRMSGGAVEGAAADVPAADVQGSDMPVSDMPVSDVPVSDVPVSDVPVADAAVTTQPGRVLAIMTADCLPVVIAGADGKSVAVAHAGWRGLAAGVLEATLEALRARTAVGTPWRAWIGPAISQRYFEVGEDVRAAFCNTDPQASQFFTERIAGHKWLADLPGLARHRLYRAGVANIELSGECTYARHDQYFSYRRDGQTGRIATVAWLE